MEAMPLPPGVSAPRVCIIGDAVAIVVDAPILDVPPPLAAMFGVGDIEEAFAGLHYEFTTFLNMVRDWCCVDRVCCLAHAGCERSR